jgi:plastocyanin
VSLAPAAAQATTKIVAAGPPSAAAKQFQPYGTELNDFFPHGVKISVGDKIKFLPNGFHTVNIPATGKAPDAFIAPTGSKIAGVNDAAGQPFWFNSQDQLNFNPILFNTLFGKKVTFNPSKGLQSGIPTGAPKPFTVTFKKAGKFTFYCNVHPGMKGTVTVAKKGTRIPTAKQDAKALKTQIANDLKIAKALPKQVVPAGTIDVGVAGPHGVEYFGMLPATLSVPVGTTVKFRMSPRSLDAHTATFGPGDPGKEPSSYLGQISASFESAQLDQRGVYPSEVPGTTGTLTPLLHGNGFWNTGAMDTLAATPLPAENSVKFGAPGTYNYYCMIHAFMHGVITVK